MEPQLSLDRRALCILGDNAGTVHIARFVKLLLNVYFFLLAKQLCNMCYIYIAGLEKWQDDMSDDSLCGITLA